MSESYTPSTDDIELGYVERAESVCGTPHFAAGLEFDRWLANVRAEAVAAERERCARIAGAETDFTEAIHAEAHRRHPVNHIVDDPFGATGEARSDPYGYEEYARGAFIAGALFQHDRERARRLRDAAAIRTPEPDTSEEDA